MESTSGETYRPHHSRSSPVLTMAVSSFADTTCHRPSTNFAPPVPPVSTTIIEPSPVRSPLRPRLLSFCRPADRLSQSLDSRIQDKPEAAGASCSPSPQFVTALVPALDRLFPNSCNQEPMGTRRT